MAVAAYATMYRIANWSAPKIEAFLHEHSELVQTLKADNLIARETNSKFAESSAKLAESHEKMTRIMESVDRHLETTDKRLEHVEQDVKEIKSHVYAAPPDK
ncbi:MAG: hypothetical protein KGI50_06985 [Patescibacteria group bacterium]|nr:hypothetical protein [Patescibacteria group bacterium]